MRLKRRKSKQWAREWIRYSLSKYGVSRIKDIPCDYHYEYSVIALSILGYTYNYTTGIKTRL